MREERGLLLLLTLIEVEQGTEKDDVGAGAGAVFLDAADVPGADVFFVLELFIVVIFGVECQHE
jgi:hypothetical protein